jgi:hypothetical protein
VTAKSRELGRKCNEERRESKQAVRQTNLQSVGKDRVAVRQGAAK